MPMNPHYTTSDINQIIPDSDQSLPLHQTGDGLKTKATSGYHIGLMIPLFLMSCKNLFAVGARNTVQETVHAVT